MKACEQEIVIVTPVWNDSARLARFGPSLARALSESGLAIGWVVADDGSSAEEKKKTQSVVADLSEHFAIIDAVYFEERTRKGGAIYQAWSLCRRARWLAFVDADGAVDASSTLKLIRAASGLGENGGCVGIRRNALEAPVTRAPGRAITFRLFSALVRLMVGIPFSDTQCGAKVVPGTAFRRLAPKLLERGYIFDVELLLALHQYGSNIQEIPIPWREMEGSKVRPVSDAWGMIKGLYRVRQRNKAEHYDLEGKS